MGQKKVMRKRLVVTGMNEMPRKKLQWLWPKRIALGTLTVLAGDFGAGKSLLTMDLAARVSRGGVWPDGRPGLGPSQILLFNHEDDPQCMSREALEAAGADMGQIVAPWEVEEICANSEFGMRNSERGSGEEGNPNGETRMTDQCRNPNDERGVEGLEDVEGLGVSAGERNAENTEGAEKIGGESEYGSGCVGEIDSVEALGGFARASAHSGVIRQGGKGLRPGA
jgi:AAA domain-containing protein